MVKRRKANHTSSLTEALGFSNIFRNEKLKFILGFLLLAVTVYLTWSFISFFSTGDADQSAIESPRAGEMLNANGEYANSCGSVGARAAYFFVKRCFGFPAFLIPLFLFLVALKLIRAYEVNLLKWFFGIAIVMEWASVTLAKFFAPLFSDSSYNPGGDHGAYAARYIENLVGTPGLTVILAVGAIAFLTYISAETIYVVRKLLNPSFFFNKIPFNVGVGGSGDDSRSNRAQEGGQYSGADIVEDPETFDDPMTQVVTFEDESAPSDNGKGYTAASEVKPLAAAKAADTGAEDKDMTVEVAKDEEKADGTGLVKVQVGAKTCRPTTPSATLRTTITPRSTCSKSMTTTGNRTSTWPNRPRTRTG